MLISWTSRTLFGLGVVVPSVEAGDLGLPSRSCSDFALLRVSSIDSGKKCLIAVVEVMAVRNIYA
jgi:hypothetical protein